MTRPEAVLEYFLPLVETRGSRKSVFDTQFELIDWLSACERDASQLRDKPQSIVQTPNFTPRLPESILAEAWRPEEATDLARALLFQMGDSLAWSHLGRSFIRGSSRVKKGGYVTFRSGFDAEVNALRQIATTEHDSIAILNDLTRCLGIGDITVVGDARVRVIEVKSTQRGGLVRDGRTVRQARRMSWLGEYLSVRQGVLPTYTDLRVTSTAGSPREPPVRDLRIRADIGETYYHQELSTLVDEAVTGRSGWAVSSLSGCGTLVVVRRDKETDCKAWTEVGKRIGEGRGERLLFGCVNKLIWRHPSLLPIPMFHMSRESRLRLLSEEVTALVLYPARTLVRALEDKGFTAKRDSPEDRGRRGLGVSFEKGDAHLTVGPYLVLRLIFELLSLESFQKTVTEGVEQFGRLTDDSVCG